MKAKKITVYQWMRILKAMGLKISIETGGYYFEKFVYEKIVKPEIGAYRVILKNNAPIFFMSQKLFLKTIQATEKSLKIKLFA